MNKENIQLEELSLQVSIQPIQKLKPTTLSWTLFVFVRFRGDLAGRAPLCGSYNKKKTLPVCLRSEGGVQERFLL